MLVHPDALRHTSPILNVWYVLRGPGPTESWEKCAHSQKKERETEKFVLALCEWSATQCQHESERSVALIECLSFSSCAQVRARGNELRHGKTSLGGVIWRFVCSLTLSVVCNADKFACSTSRYARRKVRQTMEIKHTYIFICILITYPTVEQIYYSII